MDEIALEHATADIAISVPAKVPRKVLHALPVRIDESGPANVMAYFKPSPLSEEKGAITIAGAESKSREFFEAHLRGRQLTGSIVQLPPGCTGLVCEEQPQPRPKKGAAPAPVQAGRHWKATGTFDSCYLWNRDNNRYERDPMRAALLDWNTISRALHDPLPDNAAASAPATAAAAAMDTAPS